MTDAGRDETTYGPRQRRALQSVAAQFFVNGVVFASFVPRLPEIRDRIDVDVGTLGLLLTVGGTGGLVGSALCGPAVSRFGSRATMVGGGLALVATLPVIGFATVPAVFLFGLVGLHLFDVLTDVAMNIQGSRLSALRPAPVMQRLHGLWSVGAVVGGLAATQIAAAGVSLSIHLFGVAVILIITMAFVAPGLLPTDVTPAPRASATSESASGQRTSWDRGLLLLAVMGAAAMTMELVASDWASFRLADDLEVGGGRAGFGFVAFASGMVLGRLGGDAVVSRLGGARMFRYGIVLAVAGLVWATLVPAVAVSLLGFFVAGTGIAVLFPQLYDEAAKAPGRPGAGLGMLTGGQRLAVLVMPAVVGSLANTAALSIGEAMAIVTLPSAIVLLAVHRAASAARGPIRVRSSR
ncbi:MAG: MFS transporter [Acidimicrobiia bacterium]|nr:MFS transporter [Acidimicrobiia bacterium]